MAESVIERINASGLDTRTKIEMIALLKANTAGINALIALLVTKTTITQGEANAVLAVATKE